MEITNPNRLLSQFSVVKTTINNGWCEYGLTGTENSTLLKMRVNIHFAKIGLCLLKNKQPHEINFDQNEFVKNLVWYPHENMFKWIKPPALVALVDL